MRTLSTINLIQDWPLRHPQVTMERGHKLLQGAPVLGRENNESLVRSRG